MLPPENLWEIIMKCSGTRSLALALTVLAGMGMVGAAFGQTCPTDPAVPAGPWSSKVQAGGTVAISSPGYNSTNCKMDSTLTTNNAFDQATVVDTSPANEATYRARFYFNPDDLGTLANAFAGAQIFTANAAAAHPATNSTPRILQLAVLGGGATGKQLSITASCDNGGSHNCSTLASLPAGASVIEIQVIIGANGVGAVNYWINNNVSGTPTGSVTITGGNAAWVGVDEARMGLGSPTLGFRQANLNKAAHFDEFDSRRQTFVGF